MTQAERREKNEEERSLRRLALRFVWQYLKPDLRFSVGAILCATGVSAMSLMMSLLIALFSDLLTGKRTVLLTEAELADPALLARTHHLPAALASAVDRALNGFYASPHAVLFICVGLVAIFGVRWFFTSGDTVLFAEAGQRLSVRLRNAIYAHLHGLSLRYFNEQRTGALMSTINNDLPILQGALAGMKDTAIAPPLVIVGVVAIFCISWKLSLIALLAFPLMAFTITRFTRNIRSMTGGIQDKLADVNAVMAETLGAIRIIQSFSAEKTEIERFRRLNQESKDLSMAMTRIGSKLKPTIDVIGALGMAVALYAAGSLVVQHQMTAARLITFVYMLNQISVGVGGVGGIKNTYEGIIAASTRIWKNVLSIESDVRDAPGALPLPPVQGTVELRRVAFSYKPDVPVLRDISFTIHPGEVVALVGLSGSGKSTIADLIPRFYDPQEGAVLVDGQDIRTVTVESLRRQIGIVPQETVLFGGTIRDNIAFGSPDASDAMIEAAARAANAHQFICEELSDGYATRVGERGKQLSGGQRQRIAIARALLKDPRILILDEATSSLDAESEHLVQTALDELMKGRTTLVIAHRLSTIINAARIVVLDAGRVLETGTHSELMQRPGGFYARLYRRFAEEPPEPGLEEPPTPGPPAGAESSAAALAAS